MEKLSYCNRKFGPCTRGFWGCEISFYVYERTISGGTYYNVDQDRQIGTDGLSAGGYGSRRGLCTLGEGQKVRVDGKGGTGDSRKFEVVSPADPRINLCRPSQVFTLSTSDATGFLG